MILHSSSLPMDLSMTALAAVDVVTVDANVGAGIGAV
jgi:hypothetical protein